MQFRRRTRTLLLLSDHPDSQPPDTRLLAQADRWTKRRPRRFRVADKRIEIYHDSTGSLRFHESLDPTDRPGHPLFARYADAITDYSNALEALAGTTHDPVLYSGRPDLIIEVYDTTDADQLVAVLLGEIKFSSATQTFKQGLEELLMYRRFADHDGYLTDNEDVTVTSLLITNGVTTTGASDDVVHLNGSDLLDPGIHQHPPDWMSSLADR